MLVLSFKIKFSVHPFSVSNAPIHTYMYVIYIENYINVNINIYCIYIKLQR